MGVFYIFTRKDVVFCEAACNHCGFIGSGLRLLSKSISQQVAAIVFVQMLFTILVSVIGMYVCCKGTLLSVLSACISGVAIQHIGHHLSRLISLLPGMGTWNRYMAAVVCLFLYAVVFYFIHTSHIKFLRELRCLPYSDIDCNCIGVHWHYVFSRMRLQPKVKIRT